MNRRKYVILLLAASFVGLSWWWRQAPASPQKNIQAATITPTGTKPGKSATAISTPPIAAPVAPSKSAVASSVNPTSPVAADSPKDINTTISEAISLIQSGEIVTVFKNYTAPNSYLTENPGAEANITASLAPKENTPEVQIFVQVLQTMKDQTPTYNDAGDRATYEITDPTGRSLPIRSITLQKIDGEWRFTHTDILRGAIGFGLNQNPPNPL